MNGKDYFGNDEYWKRHVNLPLEEDLWLEEYAADLPRGGAALDLGCGIGQYTRWLMERGFSVTSGDISDIALAQVARFNPNTAKIDMRRPLPFEDGQFDLVFANLSIHYFDGATTRALLEEIKRILKPGGVFAGSVNGMQGLPYIQDTAQELEHHFYWTGDRYIRLFDRADLRAFLQNFEILAIAERSIRRFENPKTYLAFVCRRSYDD